MRRAVVITFGGEGEAVMHEKTGLLAEPRNPASIASEILKILGSTEKRDALGNGARRHVEDHFSAKVTARRLEELYLRA
jgi:glycosyltransferase involved in cell wall biosynthesis